MAALTSDTDCGFVAIGRAWLPKSVYSLDVAKSGKHVAVTAGGSQLQVFEVPDVVDADVISLA